MTLAHVTDYEDRAVARLTEQFRGKAAVEALLKTWAAQAQDLEDATHNLLLQRALDTATGVNLDLLGTVVGQGRGGRSDSQFRIWIGGRILVNKSRGKTPQLIAIAAKLSRVPVRMRETYPASFIIDAQEPVNGSDGVEIAKLLNIAKAAGVQMHFVWHDSPTAFRFSLGGATDVLSARGFGQGRLAAVSDGRDMAYDAALPPGSGSGGNGALIVVL